MKKRLLIFALLFLFSIPIGLWFLLYDNTYPFRVLFHNTGFWWSWLSSTGCTLLVLTLTEYGVRRLNRYYPWKGNRKHQWLTRLSIQLLAGFLLPMALLLAWNAGFFVGRHATLRLESYIDSEYLMAGLLLLVFNAVCNTVLVLWPVQTVADPENPEQADTDPAVEPEVPTETAALGIHPLLARLGIDPNGLEERVSHILVNGRTCIFYGNKEGQEAYTVAMDALEKALSGDHFVRTHRNDVVCWQAIEAVEPNLRKHSCKIKLKAPYEGKELSVGPNYLNGFLEEWKRYKKK